MGFRLKRRSVWLLLGLMGYKTVLAQPVPVKLTKFELVPLACVAKVIGEPCHMVSQLSWQTDQTANLCFWQDDAKLTCWQGKQQVTQKIPLKLKQESEFKLLLDDDETLLATQKVKINYLENKYRRKLRAKWSIF